jgi:ATP-dependent Clp protease ATP-binding subunit ClpB
MDAERLTTRSQEAVSAAVRRAVTEGHPEVAPVHLLLALLDQSDGIAAPLLAVVGADGAAVRARAETLLAALPRANGATVAAPGLSRALMAVMSFVQAKADEIGDDYVSTEHLLVGLADSGGEVADVLRQQQVVPQHGCCAVGVQARIPQPAGRDRRLRLARHRGAGPDRRPAGGLVVRPA